MHEVLVNPLGGLSLPRKSVVRLTDRPDMTLDVYRGRKTTMQQCNNHTFLGFASVFVSLHIAMFNKTYDGMAKSVDPDQTAPNGAV